MPTQFDQVTVLTEPNVYHDGLCISHTIILVDGSKKTLGVIFPATLTFNTGAAELMEITRGNCKVRLQGENEWQDYGVGENFTVPANSSFEINALELLGYVCHFLPAA
jgi:uncharacterized protein YaiE (UPF0345 family)